MNTQAKYLLSESYPEINQLQAKKPWLWINHHQTKSKDALNKLPYSIKDIENVSARLERFAPLLAELFPELKPTDGIIESELKNIPQMADFLSDYYKISLGNSLWIKADHALPIAGSVKARGGMYDVMCFAEQLAITNNLLSTEENYTKLLSQEVKDLFAQHTVSVGSTGNLGLSIGIIAAALGFKACVHMSHEAKEWKKQRLRDRGVEVIEHETDFSSTLAIAREEADRDPFTYFVDDEESEKLFLGYSIAPFRLERQFKQQGVKVDKDHPLFVYIPCGVGGVPSGVTFGLKHVFGDNVHCFTAEPIESPSMLLALTTNLENNYCVYDIGLTNCTEADGVAVGRASNLAGNMAKELFSGCCTVEDEILFNYVYQLKECENVKIEPSATIGFAGPNHLLNSEAGVSYLEKNNLFDKMPNATHLVWTTGGIFVPDEEYSKFVERGKLANQ